MNEKPLRYFENAIQATHGATASLIRREGVLERFRGEVVLARRGAGVRASGSSHGALVLRLGGRRRGHRGATCAARAVSDGCGQGSDHGGNLMATYHLKLDFKPPVKPGSKGGPCRASAQIEVQRYSSDREGQIIISAECAGIEDLELEVRKLKTELDSILASGRRRSWY